MMRLFMPAAIILSLIASGCGDDEKLGGSTDETGTIKGSLRLTNEFGNELGDHSGMRVSISNDHFSNSNTSGSYTLYDVPLGTYDVTFEKQGFGTYKRFGIKVNAAMSVTTLNGTDFLGMQSTTLVSGLSASYQANDSTWTIACALSPAPGTTEPRAFRLFFGENQNVSFENYTYTPSNTWTSTVPAGIITGFTRATLLSNGFSAGDSVYMVAYGESVRSNAYVDPNLSKRIFPNLNAQAPSNVAGFVIP